MSTSFVIIICLLVGLGLYLSRTLLFDFIRFWAHPGLYKANFKLFDIKGSVVIQAIILSLSVSFLLALIYEGKTDYKPLHEFPTTLANAIVFYGIYAAWEELRFRILPWIATMLLRQFFEEAKTAQIISLGIGFALSILFGILHAQHYPEINIWVCIALLDPIFSGLLYWYMTEKNGVASSTLLHTITNIVAWMLATKSL